MAMQIHTPPSASADDRPRCWRCGNRDLTLVYERPHPQFGSLGMTQRWLRCTDAACAKLTID
ncbi:hypothetical protein [Reyranella soli]|uniref:hypothetical protein n=1 Tax=Reyranella soli TaxID=1230389 RepID=UPI0011BD6305|nr:hypothetical protein [Reyranella soli]